MMGDKDCALLELVPLRGEKYFKLHPQNRILVPLFEILTSTPVLVGV